MASWQSGVNYVQFITLQLRLEHLWQWKGHHSRNIWQPGNISNFIYLRFWMLFMVLLRYKGHQNQNSKAEFQSYFAHTLNLERGYSNVVIINLIKLLLGLYLHHKLTCPSTERNYLSKQLTLQHILWFPPAPKPSSLHTMQHCNYTAINSATRICTTVPGNWEVSFSLSTWCEELGGETSIGSWMLGSCTSQISCCHYGDDSRMGLL